MGGCLPVPEPMAQGYSVYDVTKNEARIQYYCPWNEDFLNLGERAKKFKWEMGKRGRSLPLDWVYDKTWNPECLDCGYIVKLDK